jgi:hypothetical protein
LAVGLKLKPHMRSGPTRQAQAHRGGIRPLTFALSKSACLPSRSVLRVVSAVNFRRHPVRAGYTLRHDERADEVVHGRHGWPVGLGRPGGQACRLLRVRGHPGRRHGDHRTHLCHTVRPPRDDVRGAWPLHTPAVVRWASVCTASCERGESERASTVFRGSHGCCQTSSCRVPLIPYTVSAVAASCDAKRLSRHP